MLPGTGPSGASAMAVSSWFFRGPRAPQPCTAGRPGLPKSAPRWEVGGYARLNHRLTSGGHGLPWGNDRAFAPSISPAGPTASEPRTSHGREPILTVTWNEIDEPEGSC